MYHPQDPNVIVFPHIIYGNKLGNMSFDWNSCNGGAKGLGSFGLTTNTFFGGRSILLGYIKELGIWGCQDKNHRENLIGFYLHDPNTVTDMAKELLANTFAKHTIQYIKYDDIPKTKIDYARLKKAQEEYESLGGSPQVIKGAQVETLESLIKAKRWEMAQEEKAARKAAQTTDPTDVVTEKKPLVTKKQSETKTA